MEIDNEKFKQIRKKAEQDYKKIGKIKCPYFNSDVHFDTKGFRHLLFKSWNKTRTRTEQYTRLRLLPLASEIISKSHTLQEYDERKLFVRQKINSRWEKKLKIVRYYIFVAIIKKKVRIKIIIKEIEGGTKFFYSLYPSWKIIKGNDSKQRKVFYSGDPETD